MPSSNNNNNEVLSFEKWVLAIFSTLILGILGWMAKTVSDSQIQYARIEERLLSQNVILVELKGRFDSATKYRLELQSEVVSLKRRVTGIERELDRN